MSLGQIVMIRHCLIGLATRANSNNLPLALRPIRRVPPIVLVWASCNHCISCSLVSRPHLKDVFCESSPWDGNYCVCVFGSLVRSRFLNLRDLFHCSHRWINHPAQLGKARQVHPRTCGSKWPLIASYENTYSVSVIISATVSQFRH